MAPRKVPRPQTTVQASAPVQTGAATGMAGVGLGWWPVRLAAAWIGLGAVLKTFSGLPGDLPAPVLALDLDPILVVTVAAGVETLVAVVALAAPQIGWWPVAALLALFTSILAGHWWQGGGSCGCFGTALILPAWLMIAIDVGLLAGTIVAARAARGSMSGPSSRTGVKVACGLGLVLAIAAAAIADRRLESVRPVESIAAVVPPDLTASAPPRAWSMPTDLPAQVLLRPSQWIGKPLADTEFGRWVDTSGFPADGRMILYYESCNHCADHLRSLADGQEADPAAAPAFILAQIPTPKAYTGRLFVDRVPKAAVHVTLPDAVGAYVITPPWDVFLEGGRVVRAERVKWSGEK